MLKRLQKVAKKIKLAKLFAPEAPVSRVVDRSAEREYEKIQQKLIEERFLSSNRHLHELHAADASEKVHWINKDPKRCYVDCVVTDREARILIDSFETAMDQICISGPHNKRGEAMINPLETSSEDIIGPVAFAVAGNCRRRTQAWLEREFEIESSKLEISGALITRLSYPSIASGSPSQIDNMLATYATPHIDKSNRINYDYSTVLYLNSSKEWNDQYNINSSTEGRGAGFEGGRFVFNDPDGKDVAVVPRAGRLLMFTSGPENLHQVQPVIGTNYRYTFGIWFKLLSACRSNY